MFYYMEMHKIFVAKLAHTQEHCLMKDKQLAMATIKMYFIALHTNKWNCWNAVCMAPAHNLNEVAIFQCKTATNDTNLVLLFNERTYAMTLVTVQTTQNT